MSELIVRAEQGLLGVMLRNPGQLPFVVDSLEADDFSHERHRAVYRTLTEADTLDLSVNERIARVATVAEVHLDPDWLRTLADTAPPEALMPGYYRIVYEAAFERDITGLAEPYRLAAAAYPDPHDRAELLKLADVLDAQSAYFGGPVTDIVLPARSSELDLRVALTREDQVIADIVQHPERARDVAAWLDSSVFTTEQRRHTFEFAVSLGYDRDTFDAVTLAWQVNRAQNLAAYPGPTTPPASIDADYTYLTRLYAATVASGTAIIVGRELLTAHVQAQHQPTINVTAQADHSVAAGPQPAPQRLHTPPPLHQAPATNVRPIEL